MAKSILILSTSLRAGSNSETLANAFAGGVTEPGAIAGHPALETARAMGAAIA